MRTRQDAERGSDGASTPDAETAPAGITPVGTAAAEPTPVRAGTAATGTEAQDAGPDRAVPDRVGEPDAERRTGARRGATLAPDDTIPGERLPDAPDGERSPEVERPVPAQRGPAPQERLEPARRPARVSVLRMPRSRGAVSAFLLALLGIWGAVAPFVGPYVGYSFGSPDAWVLTTDRIALSVIPGVAVLLGALVLGSSGHRIAAGWGAWLALIGGAWFVVGPVVSVLWGGHGPGAPIGAPLGSTGVVLAEQVGFFFGLGVLIVALAAGAMGRVSIRSAREVPQPN
jgi:hypothetical protein